MKKLLILLSTLSLLLVPIFEVSIYKGIYKLVDNPLVGLVSVNGGASGSVIKRWRTNDGKWHFYVLTGNHCILKFTDKQTVEFREYSSIGKIVKTIKAEGKVVEVNEEQDYAIIKCVADSNVQPIRCISPSKAESIRLLDRVYSVGCPASEFCWVGTGRISSLNPKQANAGWYGHDAGIWYGNSGGPLLNKDYVQIGVNLQIKVSVFPVPTIAFSLPLSVIYDDLGPEKTEEYFGFRS